MASSYALLVVSFATVFQLVNGLSGSENPSGSCPNPYIDVGGKCLYFHSVTNDTWLNLEALCTELNGHLVKIDDANLLYDIISHIYAEEPTMESIWIGGSDAAAEGDWRWIDNSAVKMGTPFWGTTGRVYPQVQEPAGGTHENCICLNRGYLFYFHDYSCDLVFGGICEYYTS
ncbi:C-type lectin domain family 17, member A-like [Macrobrachium rosenbergii]|uniref:C-type lectin domain family 17, member A-like n=1 Tax=Macrobrachium rosenbergii TaxID=79674 RepID=UPI0034D4527D